MMAHEQFAEALVDMYALVHDDPEDLGDLYADMTDVRSHMLEMFAERLLWTLEDDLDEDELDELRDSMHKLIKRSPRNIATALNLRRMRLEAFAYHMAAKLYGDDDDAYDSFMNTAQSVIDSDEQKMEWLRNNE